MFCSLGIDASARSSGLSFIAPNNTVVKTIKPSKKREGARLLYIEEQLIDFLDKRIGDPSLVVMEGPSLYSINKPFILGEVYGLYKHVLYKRTSQEILIVSPKELKKYLCANGSATKDAMKKRAVELGCPSSQEDICDSYAAALLAQDLLNGTNTPGTRKSLEVISKYSSIRPKN